MREITTKWVVNSEGFYFEIYNNSLKIFINTQQELEDYTNKSLVIQLLNQFLDEDKAYILDGKIVVPHHTIASLPQEELEILELPELFPFKIEIKASQRLTDKNFRYVYHFLDGKLRPFVNFTRIGTYLEITSEQIYLLTGELFFLLEAIDEFNKKTSLQKDLATNLLSFAKIKGLAKETGAILDSYLNSQEVITPQKISLRLKRINDDIIEIEPVLCEVVKQGENSILKPLLDEDQSKDFLKKFDRLPPRNIYPSKPRVVLNSEQKDALVQIKKHRHVSGKKKELLLKNPSAFFDPNLIDLDTPLLEKDGKLVSWSDRVIDIGEYKPRFFSFIHPAKEAWLPPEGGIIIDGKLIYLSTDEAVQLKERLEKAIQKNEREINWKGEKIPVNEECIRVLSDLIEVRSSSEDISKEVVSKVKNKKEKNILIIKDNFLEADYTAQKQLRVGEPSLPKALKKDVSLLPHQIEGLEWLQKLWISGAKGALLADDMGLGKTLQALSFMAWVQEIMDKSEGYSKPMLIVAPVALLENWKEEYIKFFNPIWGPFIEIHGKELKKFKKLDVIKTLNVKKEIEIKNKENIEDIILHSQGILLNLEKIPKKSVVITTYETLRDYQFSFGLVDWGIIVIDEAQKIKTPNTLVTTAIKAMKYEFGLALTGTPVENSWVDLWSIMDFVQPSYLGSLKEFVNKFHNPLRNPDTDKISLGLRLKEKISPLFKRRMKEDRLKGLPKKHICVYRVEMPSIQLEYYLNVIYKAKKTLSNSLEKNKKEHIFSIIGALRNISLHPYLSIFNEQGLASLTDDEIINSSARLIKTIEILDKIKTQNKKVVIFLFLKKMQRILQRIIRNRYNIYPYIINGETSPSKRKSYIDAFQNTDGFNVIIISPEAAGIGLNITSANHVIHLSRPWNPAKEDQATDRVYRIGQKQDVFIHIPLAVHPMFDNDICKGTFDIKLHCLLEQKRELSKSVLLPTIIEDKEWQLIGEEILGLRVEEEKNIFSVNIIDKISPLIFEKVVAALYRKMGYQVQLTPQSYDQGADIVAIIHGKKGNSLLIQCKHTKDPNKSQNQSGVQEILEACSAYQKEYDIKFKPVVVTNSYKFTESAIKIAKENNVELIERNDLLSLLDKYKIDIDVI